MLRRIMSSLLIVAIVSVGLMVVGCGKPKVDAKVETHEEVNIEQTVGDPVMRVE